tara:strand:- start:550 stop:2262 length:1713 start_codon:yes stop_codon:yes gene_type:complete
LAKQNYHEFITSKNPLYSKYYADWQLAVRSYYGGQTYRDGKYLKAYASDYSTGAETINTYDLDGDGNTVGVRKAVAHNVSSPQEANSGVDLSNYYQEKLANVPVFPYTRLYISEYNAMLFRVPPQRTVPDTPEVNAFLNNADGDQNSLNEFMSMVDTFTSAMGVVWVSCIKPTDSPYPKWRMHKPTDVTNWSYKYTTSGDLVLDRIVIRIAQDYNVEIYQVITDDYIDTIFVAIDPDEDISVPEGAEYIEGDDDYDGYHRIRQPNELGTASIVRPVYQSTPIVQGIGHTPIFDIAQIQRSVYSLAGEQYSAVSYGLHGVNVVDEETFNRNGNNVGAEPGSLVIVSNSLDGQPNYTYTFESPDLSSLSEIGTIMDQQIDKMNQVAMIRSEDLIKASRSGAQIEMYDSKLEAFIRKKATSMENAEYNLWKIWFAWMGQTMPEDFSISYNRLYNQKGLENEIKEMNTLIDAYTRYSDVFDEEGEEYTVSDYSTEAEAEAEANRLGGTGNHSHIREDGLETYMPFATHLEYEMRLEQMTGENMTEAPEFKQRLKEKLQYRLNQLIDSTYTNNSL